MVDVVGRIREIEEELARLPNGYISKKMINAKERFYLQWLENGKLKSKYKCLYMFQRFWVVLADSGNTCSFYISRVFNIESATKSSHNANTNFFCIYKSIFL